MENQAMVNPEGTLTAAQHEILEVIWNGPDCGATVTEIWQASGEPRELSRTTVLNQVDRLEKRGWLRRKKYEDGFRYLATRSRDDAARGLAEEFVNDFFGGSPSELVMSLLGSNRLKPAEIARLRALLDAQSAKRQQKPKS
jgi:BlaI family penicillinase repressor